jgi:hypothetical protein
VVGQGAVEICWLVVQPFRDAFCAVLSSIVRRSAYIAPNVVLMLALLMSAPMSTTARWSTPGRRSAQARRLAKTVTSRRGWDRRVLEPLQAEPVIIETTAYRRAQRGRRGSHRRD